MSAFMKPPYCSVKSLEARINLVYGICELAALELAVSGAAEDVGGGLHEIHCLSTPQSLSERRPSTSVEKPTDHHGFDRKGVGQAETGRVTHTRPTATQARD